MTVGSGIAPDLLTRSDLTTAAALAGLPNRTRLGLPPVGNCTPP